MSTDAETSQSNAGDQGVAPRPAMPNISESSGCRLSANEENIGLYSYPEALGKGHPAHDHLISWDYYWSRRK